jgi:hypothetical protein
MATIGKILVKFLSDTTGFKKGVKEVDTGLNKTTKKVSAFTSSLKKIAPAIGAAFAVRAIAKFASQSVKLFDEQERAMAKVSTAVAQTGMAAGFTAKELAKTASELQKMTTFGDEDIMSNVTAQLLTFTGIGQEQFKRTQMAALDLATLLDGDLKSASIQLGKALNDPVANLSALSRSGIQFSTEQKETIKKLAETNRLADAQTVILDELNKQYGGQAAAQAKIGLGPWRQIKNQIGDMREEMGARMMPIINKFGAIVLELLPKIQAGFKKAREAIRNVANGFIDVYNNSILLRTYIGLLGAYFKTTFAGIKLVIQQAFLPIKTFSKVIGAILKGDFKKIPEIMKEGFKKGVDNYKEFGQKAVDNFSGAIKKAKNSFIEPLKISDSEGGEISKTYSKAGADVGTAFAVGVREKITELNPLKALTDDKKIFDDLAKESEKALERVFGKDTKDHSKGSHIQKKTTIDIDYSQQVEQVDKLADSMDNLNKSAYDMGQSIMQAGIDSEGSMKSFGKTTLNIIRKTISALIAQGIAGLISKTLGGPTGALGPLAVPIAMGAGGLAAALFNSAIPSFAGGGMVSSPTIAMIGDAKDGRPEYVLNSGQMDNMTRNRGGVLTAMVSGRDLKFILDQENGFVNRT